MKYSWQFTCFLDEQDLVDWMNRWDFIKVDHIASCGISFIAFYRYHKKVLPNDIPTQEDFNEALWT